MNNFVMQQFKKHMEKVENTMNPHYTGNVKKLVNTIAKDFFENANMPEFSKGKKVLLFSDKIILSDEDKKYRKKISYDRKDLGKQLAIQFPNMQLNLFDDEK